MTLTVGTIQRHAEANTLISQLFALQKGNQQTVAQSTAKERIAKLKKLRDAIMKYKEEIRTALYKDYRKHPSEVDLTEIYPITGEIKHAISNIRSWMRKEYVDTPLALLGSSSYILKEPKGVVLIISPWNFPVNLTFGPLISAVAAGNCVMIKPSEMTPNASAIMGKIVKEVFEEKEVAIVEGGIETSTALLKMPFNHIFFTGAPSIGKIVMEAAAKNLASVTLELGGKSPTIIDETANLGAAATRLAWGKFLNNGQICIAPDYVFVHESKKEAFIKLVAKKVKQFYGEDQANSESYNRIVNNRHFKRLNGYVEDAVAKGGKIEFGGQTDKDQDYIAPTLMTNVNPNSRLMKEEIFGPILPVYGYTNIEEPLKMINSKEKPLSLYIYSKSSKNINHILENTRAGGTCINHNAIHFFNNNLPFGGSNNSGIGKGHGKFGFDTFTNQRAVYKQVSPMSAIELMMPPYTNLKQKLIDLSIKWF